MKTFKSVTTTHLLTEEERKEVNDVKQLLMEMYENMCKYVGENHTVGIKGNVIRVKEIGDAAHILAVLSLTDEVKYLGSEEVNM